MEYSYGVVPIYKNKEGEYEFLLINQKSQANSFRGFPKGHKEQGETDIQAAKRELKEETGVSEINIISNKKRSLQYIYRLGTEKRNKKVIFRAGYALNNKVVVQQLEVNEYFRYTKKQAIDKLTHKDAKTLLMKICRYLEIE